MHKCPRNAHTNPVRRKESKFMVLEPGWDLKKGDRFLKEEDLRGGSASRCSNLLKMLAKNLNITIYSSFTPTKFQEEDCTMPIALQNYFIYNVYQLAK